jgi:caffeoyl-CoA O-methyltransferase
MADQDSRSGARYASPEILAHVDRVHAAHDAALAAAFDAPAREGMPRIMVGPSEGKLLSLLLRLVGAERVVEIGTLAGYSAIHMARALPASGQLWTIEADPAHAEVARRNVARAGLSDQIQIVVGAALDVLPQLEKHGPFDAVFLDADKELYDRYARWAVRNVRTGGLVLGDNAFFFGNLLADTSAAEAMRRFHQVLSEHCASVCIPTPDGLALGVKR